MEMRSKRELGMAGRRFWKNHCKDFGFREMGAGEPLASASIRTEYLFIGKALLEGNIWGDIIEPQVFPDTA